MAPQIPEDFYSTGSSSRPPVFRPGFSTPLTPTADPLTIRIACRTNNGPLQHHRVSVHTDGHVDSPHNLELEEIAQRLGGGRPPACLVFARDVVPVILSELPVLLRHERPDIAIGPQGRLRHRDALWCCRAITPGRSLSGVKDVCDHVRSLDHLHRKYANKHYLIGVLLDQLFRAWGGLESVPEDRWGAAEYAPTDQTLSDWWDIGIHPRDVAMLAEASTPPGEQIPLFGHDIVRAAYPAKYNTPEEDAESVIRSVLCSPPHARAADDPWVEGL